MSGNPIWQSVSDSGPVGNAILIILFAASIITWTVIIQKFVLLRQVNRSADYFLSRFRKAGEKIASLPRERLEKGCDEGSVMARLRGLAAWGRKLIAG